MTITERVAAVSPLFDEDQYKEKGRPFSSNGDIVEYAAVAAANELWSLWGKEDSDYAHPDFVIRDLLDLAAIFATWAGKAIGELYVSPSYSGEVADSIASTARQMADKHSWQATQKLGMGRPK